MRNGGAALALLLIVPATGGAQDVTIAHEAVGCIVSGRFPKMSACITPAALVRKARVYFRPETLSTWYYVEMGADGQCSSAALPKPGKALANKKIFYYVDVQGEGSARTPEYAPTVVATADLCRTGMLAPVSVIGPAAVFPTAPAGFAAAGGISGAAVVGGGVAAIGAVGGAAALAGGDDPPATTTPTTVANPPVTSPAPTPTQPAEPPPTPVPGGTLALSCQAAPRSGTAPLAVTFGAFPTGASGTYEFAWTFGDGATSSNPNAAYTYATPGRFDATVRVTSGSETATCTRDITVTAAAPPGPTPAPTPTPVPTPTPTPTPTPPPPPVMRTLTATVGGNFIGSVSSAPAGLNCNLGQTCNATFTDGTSVTVTGSAMLSANITISGACSANGMGTASCTVLMNADKAIDVIIFRSSVQERAPAFALTSDLQVAGAVATVFVNGGATALRPGRAVIGGEGRPGAQRVEGLIDRADGQPGTWHFDLGAAGIVPGSLRVTAGTVALITPDAVDFRLQGKPGERVAFTFEME